MNPCSPLPETLLLRSPFLVSATFGDTADFHVRRVGGSNDRKLVAL
jgi:hypothetical protein